jgi:hypothetical protein
VNAIRVRWRASAQGATPSFGGFQGCEISV